jgi:nucleoid-associated protein YgaU
MPTKRKASLLGGMDKETFLSVGLGAIVVIVIGLLISNYFIKVQKMRHPSEEEGAIIEQSETPPGASKAEKPIFEFAPTELPTEHTIVKGEYLWGLAIRYFNDGYKWVAIAQENKLTNPDLIFPDQKLIIPKLEPSEESQKLVERIEALGGKIEGEEYTVVKGDDLCKIALRAYGDCTKGWEIARVNNLANPHIIHAGNVLNLPRD